MNAVITTCAAITSVMIVLLFSPRVYSDDFPKERNKEVVKKIKDFVIYEDEQFYSSFPSIVINDNDELLLAFRRAPDRKVFGEEGTSHVDPNSYLVMVRSEDNGETWTDKPELIYAHPFGGSQDPCLLKLHDGTLLCTSYGWAFLRKSGHDNLKAPVTVNSGEAVFLGGYIVRSANNGKTWEGPAYPPSIPSELRYDAFGNPLPAYNRGALYEGMDGTVYWAVAASTDKEHIGKTSVHLLTSDDKGITWANSGVIASDEKAAFNETSVYETPEGDIVAFLRTAGLDDQACIARSQDKGKTFSKWEKMGFQGHPLQAIRLPDNRVFLVYGYRHPPYGIRARILNQECTDYLTAEEIIIRDDGGSGDIGYPWAVLIDENQILIVYYFNKNNGTRHIAGSVLEITG